MNPDEHRYKHEDLTKRIIRVFFEVYNEPGYGFMESVYRKAMTIALRQAGLHVYKEFPLSARFRGQTIGEFKADLVVNGVASSSSRLSEPLSRSMNPSS